MNQTKFKSSVRIISACIILMGAFGSANLAEASVNPTAIQEKCKNYQDAFKASNDYAQALSADPVLNAITKVQDEMPWTGSFGGGCLDILPTGISLTLTFPTMEEIIEAIMKQIAAAICKGVREKIGGNINKVISEVSSSTNVGGNVAGLNFGGGLRVGKAQTGVVPSSVPKTAPTSNSTLPPVTVVGVPQATAKTWNPAAPGAASNPVAPANAPAKNDDGFFSSVSRKVSCWFGGSCQ